MRRLPLLTGERLAPSPVPLAAHGQSLPPAVCSGTEGGVSMTSTVDGAIRAAGGVVFRLGPGEPVIAVVHRPEHDDWVLPKGKLEAGESARDAALREVKEETGQAVAIGDFIGCLGYEVKGRPKLVEFWAMETTLPKGSRPTSTTWLGSRSRKRSRGSPTPWSGCFWRIGPALGERRGDLDRSLSLPRSHGQHA
jgi:ADP-ribose pyrophosphatase YjhB (NUDIX family)